MRFTSGWSSRCGVSVIGLLCAVALTQAQTQGGRGNGPDAVVRQVRTALGHGRVDDAQRIAEGAAPSAFKELATALVEIYRGHDDAAKARLQAGYDRGTRGETALELGLLLKRHGERDAATRMLDPLTRQTLSTPDDYFLLARAARAIGEYKLASDAYIRIADSPRPEVAAERGDLFYQFHQFGDAATDYQAALTRDPEWVPAHLGLSRAYSHSDPEEAAASLDAARKIAPDHPDVLLLSAERNLEAEDAAAARTALDRVAQVRPNTAQEFSLRAALAYLERKPAEVEAAVAKVKEIDPTSALGYRTAADQAARKYRFQDAADYVRKGIAIDPRDAAAQGELGLYLLRTGDEPEARVALEASFKLDASDAIVKNLLEMLDQLDTFEVVPHGEFIFKFAKGEGSVLKPYALPLADEAYKTFTARYGFKPMGPILVEVFARHDDFAVRTVGLMGITGALGACFGRVVTMDSPKARPPGDFSWQATLWHEIAHVFTLQSSQYRVPRWLTEGISVFEEHRKVPAWGRELALEFAHNLSAGKTFGVKKLPDAFKKPESLSFAYFEASLLVEHLSELAGDAGVRTLLSAYADGATDTEAFSKAFGKNIDAVETSFAAFVKARYGDLATAMADPKDAAPIAPDNLDALKVRAAGAPGSFLAQLALGRALYRSGDLAAARPVLEKASALAPQAQGASSPHALLADIAVKENDRPRARKELRELLQFDHTNVDAARRLAALALQDKAVEDQDLALRLIADLQPFDLDVHSQLGKREMAKGRPAAAVIEFEAALALRPPNMAEAYTDLGEALLGAGRKDDAKRQAFLALKEAPNFARAQDLLLAAAR